MSKKYVDADGHVMINERELNEFIEPPFTAWGYMTKSRMMPSLDEFHTPSRITPRKGTFDWNVGPKEWVEFLEKTGIESSVLYTTGALAYGHIQYPEWALGFARAYNNWLHEKYLKASPRFRGSLSYPCRTLPWQWKS